MRWVPGAAWLATPSEASWPIRLTCRAADVHTPLLDGVPGEATTSVPEATAVPPVIGAGTGEGQGAPARLGQGAAAGSSHQVAGQSVTLKPLVLIVPPPAPMVTGTVVVKSAPASSVPPSRVTPAAPDAVPSAESTSVPPLSTTTAAPELSVTPGHREGPTGRNDDRRAVGERQRIGRLGRIGHRDRGADLNVDGGVGVRRRQILPIVGGPIPVARCGPGHGVRAGDAGRTVAVDRRHAVMDDADDDRIGAAQVLGVAGRP